MGRHIVIAGGSGFLGRALARQGVARGDRVTVLTRQTAIRGQAGRRDAVDYVTWDARTLGPWAAAVDGADVLVNYVGRSVDCRKTPANKREILESRVESVRVLGEAVGQARRRPAVWVQQSTAHIYGDTWDEVLDESSPIGKGLAPEVGTAWEAALDAVGLPDVRKVVFRTSFVLGRDGGALLVLARLARWGLGGTIGSGRQYISWIHIDDVNAAVLRAIEDRSMSGVYVLTGPSPVTNREFMAELRRAVGRPWSPPAPGLMVRLGSFVMNSDPELALLGRRCVPRRLLAEGFVFGFPELRGALRDLLS